MNYLWISVGIFLICIGLIDIVLTILNYEGYSYLTKSYYRVIWKIMQFLYRPFGPSLKRRIQTLVIPFLIIATLGLWLCLEIVGFALVYMPYINSSGFRTDLGITAKKPFWEALYLSGVTMTTLGYGDISPRTPFFQIIAFIQGFFGFGIITISVSYVLNVYASLHRFSTMSIMFCYITNNTMDYKKILATYYTAHKVDQIDSFLMSLTKSFTSYSEELRHYPLLYYHHSRNAMFSVISLIYQSTLLVTTLLLAYHYGTKTPRLCWFSALYLSILNITDHIQTNFIAKKKQKDRSRIYCEMLTFEQFVTEKSLRDNNVLLDAYLCTEEWLVKGDVVPYVNKRKSYLRYRAWYRFTAPVFHSICNIVSDLDYAVPSLKKI